MAALHPAEYPRDGSQVFQAAALLSTSGTRSDACMFQFVDRSCQLEVVEHAGIVSNILAIEGIRKAGHLFHRRIPATRTIRMRYRSGQRFGTSGYHQFKIPLCQYRISILPVQYFALLRDANLSAETADRLGQDCRVGRSATPSDRSTPTMKKP